MRIEIAWVGFMLLLALFLLGSLIIDGMGVTILSIILIVSVALVFIIFYAEFLKRVL